MEEAGEAFAGGLLTILAAAVGVAPPAMAGPLLLCCCICYYRRVLLRGAGRLCWMRSTQKAAKALQRVQQVEEDATAASR